MAKKPTRRYGPNPWQEGYADDEVVQSSLVEYPQSRRVNVEGPPKISSLPDEIQGPAAEYLGAEGPKGSGPVAGPLANLSPVDRSFAAEYYGAEGPKGGARPWSRPSQEIRSDAITQQNLAEEEQRQRGQAAVSDPLSPEAMNPDAQSKGVVGRLLDTEVDQYEARNMLPLSMRNDWESKQDFVISNYPTLYLAAKSAGLSRSETYDVVNLTLATDAAQRIVQTADPRRQRELLNSMPVPQRALTLDIINVMAPPVKTKSGNTTRVTQKALEPGEAPGRTTSAANAENDNPVMGAIEKYVWNPGVDSEIFENLPGPLDLILPVEDGRLSFGLKGFFDTWFNGTEVIKRGIGTGLLGGAALREEGGSIGEVFSNAWESTAAGSFDPTMLAAIRENNDPLTVDVMLEFKKLAAQGVTGSDAIVELLDKFGSTPGGMAIIDSIMLNTDPDSDLSRLAREIDSAETSNPANIAIWSGASIFGNNAANYTDIQNIANNDVVQSAGKLFNFGTEFGADPLLVGSVVRAGMKSSRYGMARMSGAGIEESFNKRAVVRLHDYLGKQFENIRGMDDVGQQAQKFNSLVSQNSRWYSPSAMKVMYDAGVKDAASAKKFLTDVDNLDLLLSGQAAKRGRQRYIPHMSMAGAVTKATTLKLRGLNPAAMGGSARYIDAIFGEGTSRMAPEDAVDEIARAIEADPEVAGRALGDFTGNRTWQSALWGGKSAKEGAWRNRYGWQRKSLLGVRRGSGLGERVSATVDRWGRLFAREPQVSRGIDVSSAADAVMVKQLAQAAGMSRYFANYLKFVWPSMDEPSRVRLINGLNRTAIYSTGIDLVNPDLARSLEEVYAVASRSGTKYAADQMDLVGIRARAERRVKMLDDERRESNLRELTAEERQTEMSKAIETEVAEESNRLSAAGVVAQAAPEGSVAAMKKLPKNAPKRLKSARTQTKKYPTARVDAFKVGDGPLQDGDTIVFEWPENGWTGKEPNYPFGDSSAGSVRVRLSDVYPVNADDLSQHFIYRPTDPSTRVIDEAAQNIFYYPGGAYDEAFIASMKEAGFSDARLAELADEMFDPKAVNDYLTNYSNFPAVTAVPDDLARFLGLTDEVRPSAVDEAAPRAADTATQEVTKAQAIAAGKYVKEIEPELWARYAKEEGTKSNEKLGRIFIEQDAEQFVRVGIIPGRTDELVEQTVEVVLPPRYWADARSRLETLELVEDEDLIVKETNKGVTVRLTADQYDDIVGDLGYYLDKDIREDMGLPNGVIASFKAAQKRMEGVERPSAAADKAAPKPKGLSRKERNEAFNQEFNGEVASARENGEITNPSALNATDNYALHDYQLTRRVSVFDAAKMNQYTARQSMLNMLLFGGRAGENTTNLWVLATLAGPRFVMRSGVEDFALYALTNGKFFGAGGWLDSRKASAAIRESIERAPSPGRQLGNNPGMKLGLATTSRREVGTRLAKRIPAFRGLVLPYLDEAEVKAATAIAAQEGPQRSRKAIADLMATAYARMSFFSLNRLRYAKGDPLKLSKAKARSNQWIKDGVERGYLNSNMDRASEVAEHLADGSMPALRQQPRGSEVVEGVTISYVRADVQSGKLEPLKTPDGRVINRGYTSEELSGSRNPEQVQAVWTDLDGFLYQDGFKGYAAITRSAAYYRLKKELAAARKGSDEALEAQEKLREFIADFAEAISDDVDRFVLAKELGVEGFAERLLDDALRLMTTNRGSYNQKLMERLLLPNYTRVKISAGLAERLGFSVTETQKMKTVILNIDQYEEALRLADELDTVVLKEARVPVKIKPVKGTTERRKFGLYYLDEDGKFRYNLSAEDFFDPDLPMPQSVNMANQVTIPVTDKMPLTQGAWSKMGRALARLTREPIYISNYVDMRELVEPFARRMEEGLVKGGMTKDLAREQAEDWAARQAADKAYELTMAYVDNPAIRSQAAWQVRNVARFYRALEDFYRRMLRTTQNNPMALAKAAITWNALDDSGFVWEDEYGEKYFMFPGTQMLFSVVNLAASSLGIQMRVPSLPLTWGARVTMLMPSTDPNAAIPTLGSPMAAISIKSMLRLMPSLGVMSDTFADNAEGLLFGEYSPSQTLASSMMNDLFGPNLKRLVDAGVPLMGGENARWQAAEGTAATTGKQAIHALMASGLFDPTKDYTDEELMELRSVADTTAMNALWLKLVTTPLLIATPQTMSADVSNEAREIGFDSGNAVWLGYLNAHPTYEEAFIAFTKDNPGKAIFTVSKYENTDYYQSVVGTEEFIQNNREEFEARPTGLSYFAPTEGEYGGLASFKFMRANGIKVPKTVEDYWSASIRSTGEAELRYLDMQVEADRLTATTDDEKKIIDRAEEIEKDRIKSQYPYSEYNKSIPQDRKATAIRDAEEIAQTAQYMIDSGQDESGRAKKFLEIYDNYKLAKADKDSTEKNSKERRTANEAWRIYVEKEAIPMLGIDDERGIRYLKILSSAMGTPVEALG